MPWNNVTKTASRIWSFVDQFAAGENATRASFDTALNDAFDTIQDVYDDAATRIDALEVRDREGIVPEEYGAVGDGATDDGAALEAFFAAGEGKTLSLRNGATYRSDRKLTLPSGSFTLRANNATIDFSNMDVDTTGALLGIAGAAAAPVDIADIEAVEANNNTFSVHVTTATAHGLSVGDDVLLSSDDVIDIGHNETSETRGQFAQVLSVISNTRFEIQKPLYEDLITNPVMTPVNWREGFRLEGTLTLIGPGRRTTNEVGMGLSLEYCRDFHIEALRTIDVDYQAVSLDNCLRFTGEYLDVRFPPKGDSDIIQYGLTLKNACTDGEWHTLTGRGGKHLYDWTRNEKPGIGRNCKFGTIIGYDADSALVAMHGNSRDNKIDYVKAVNCLYGVNVRAPGWSLGEVHGENVSEVLRLTDNPLGLNCEVVRGRNVTHGLRATDPDYIGTYEAGEIVVGLVDVNDATGNAVHLDFSTIPVFTESDVAVTGGTTTTITMGDFPNAMYNNSGALVESEIVIDLDGAAGLSERHRIIRGHTYAGGVNTLTVSDLGAVPTTSATYTLRSFVDRINIERVVSRDTRSADVYMFGNMRSVRISEIDADISLPPADSFTQADSAVQGGANDGEGFGTLILGPMPNALYNKSGAFQLAELVMDWDGAGGGTPQSRVVVGHVWDEDEQTNTLTVAEWTSLPVAGTATYTLTLVASNVIYVETEENIYPSRLSVGNIENRNKKPPNIGVHAQDVTLPLEMVDDWSAASLAKRKLLDALDYEGILDKMDEIWLVGRDQSKSLAGCLNRYDLRGAGTDWRVFPEKALVANHGRNTEYFSGDENGNDNNGAVPNGESYFRTGYIPAQSGQMEAESAHAAIFIVEPGLQDGGLTYRGTPRSNLSPAIGSKNPNGDSTTAESLIKLRPLDTNHNVLFRLNTDADITVSGAKTHVGMHTVTRTGSTCAAYHNGGLLGTASGSGSTLSEYEVLFGGHFDDGDDEYGDYPFAMASFGSYLTAAEVETLYDAVREYLLELEAIEVAELVAPIRQVPREWTYAAKARIDLTKGEALTSYTRTGASAVINASGYWEAVAADTWAVDHDPYTREPKGLRTYNDFEQIETQSGALSNARFQAVGSTKATVTTAVGAYGDVGSPVSYVQTTANSEHGVEADYANADIDDYVQFDVHLRPYGASDPVLSDIGVLLEVVGKDGAVQGWVWYHWNHDRIEQSGGGAYNVELNRFYDGMRRVSLSVPAGSGAGDVTCRVLSVDPAADWQVAGKPSVSFVGDTGSGFLICGWQVTTETDDWAAYCKPYLLTTGVTAAVGDHTARLDVDLPLSGQRLYVASRFEFQVGSAAGAQVWRAHDASDNLLGRVTQFNTDGSLGIIANYSGASVQTLVTETEAEAYQDLRIVYGRDAVADRHLRMTNCREYTPTTPSDTIAATNPVAYFTFGATAAGAFVFPGWMKEFHFFDQTPHPYDLREFTNLPNRGTMQPALVAPVSALASPWVPRLGLVPVQAGKDAPWVSIAKQEIGVCSWVTGDNPEVMKYYQSALNTSEFFAGLDSTSYCAAGMNWCLQEAGLQGVKDIWAYAFNYYGAALSEYVPGAILTIAKSETERNIRHVTFCIADVGSGVLTLGFNQGGNLRNNYAVFPKSEVYAIRWPTMPA